ncbi:DAK2 domain-containing protein [Modestobacter sp. L9-4]|uniref:DAK2 domain-containing protein n=1 Tax=Modestobacter sp. L9-4 TaxID=2851567 RepID=UPI001C75588F|nr:DAK2 domain-containing protein [Modestobacter sp. L9-4]QXG76930.1 DAK2 domain-containing protein [Modestobacter sp. L9-4]
MLEALDEAAVGRWSRAVVDTLAQARGRLDELNVFPVPDGDTGTNLLMTAEAGRAALETADGAESSWTVLARGAVLGARGNSGAILAQLLHGLADALAGARRVDGRALAEALAAASRTAYTAVADPEEGTFLTVARAGAEAAVAAVAAGRERLADVVHAAAEGALTALQATPGQLAALRDAGVVDAGGAGWCLVLDALVGTVTGTVPARAPLGGRPARLRGLPAPVPAAPAPGPGSEVQFLLADSDETAVARLRTRLAELGDCLVVVGVDTPGGREWNVHVHVADVGAAVEAGIEAGRPHRISVTALAPVRAPLAAAGTRATVALTCSAGLADLFAGEGVAVLTAPVGELTEDAVLAAVLGTGAAQVVVLPNHAEATAVTARAAERAREDGRDVVVVPTRSAVQGLAALAVADPARRFGDDVVAMAEAAAATRWAEVTVAGHDALTSAGRCAAGDVLGSAEGDVVVIGPDLAAVARDLLDRLLSAGGEMVTVVVGEDPALGDAVCAHLAAVHPTVDVVRYAGGAGAVPLLVGVE